MELILLLLLLLLLLLQGGCSWRVLLLTCLELCLRVVCRLAGKQLYGVRYLAHCKCRCLQFVTST